MTTAETSKPRIGNITRYFLPGLVLGLAVGAIGGAFYAPRLEQGPIVPPRVTAAAAAARSKAAPEERPAPEGQPGSTGAAPAAATGAPK